MIQPEPEHLTQPMLSRLLQAGMGLLWWTIGGWMALLWLFQSWLLPDWPPLARVVVAAAVAILLGVVVTLVGFLKRVYSIVYLPGIVELRRGTGVDRISTPDVVGLIGQGRLNFDFEGGDLVAWKKLVILTRYETFTLDFDDNENKLVYAALRERCPRAWCIPFRGDLEPPVEWNKSIEEQQAQLALSQIKSIYRRNVFRSLALSLGLVIGSVLVGLAVFWQGKFDPSILKGAVWLIVLVVAGLLLLAEIPREMAVLRKIRREENSWQESI